MQTAITTTDKNNYSVFKFQGGYYGICLIGSFGGECIWGGDSAWEDCYSLELAQSIYEQWNGELVNGKI